jgi:DNA (cytosine-5)-methyltransferase 1
VQDITKWDKDIEVDLVMHGSPCQDFSLAGKQAGGDLGSGTRSSLMYETIRIVEKLEPKYVVWENVKNLLSKKHRHNFDAYLKTMEQLGYNNYYQVLNAKDYGIPQNRERIFVVSIRKDIDKGDFEFPQKENLKQKLKDLLEDKVDEKYYLSDEQLLRIKTSTYIQNQRRIQEKEYCDTLCARDWKDPKCVEVTRKYGVFDTEKSKHQAGSVYDENGLAPTLDTMQGGWRQPCIEEKLRIRKLTPKECWRLMGFNDEDFEKASKVCSNTQLYKQAGNSIVVNVLVEILRNLLVGGVDNENN